MSRPPITIRRARLDDAAAYARIMGDPAVYPGLMQLPYPSEDQWHARLTESLGPGRTDLVLVAEREGAVVGTSGLHPVSAGLLRRRHVMVLGISVEPGAQGQGVGTALMQAMCDYADHWGQVLRIELNVFTDNARALALYQRFGFVIEGTHRAYALRGGAYVDSHSMARLHPKPPSLPTSLATSATST